MCQAAASPFANLAPHFDDIGPTLQFDDEWKPYADTVLAMYIF